MMVHSPHSNFNLTLSDTTTTDVLEAHYLLEQVCSICSPDYSFDNPAIFSGERYMLCSGSGSGSGSTSPSEEAQLSQRGKEAPQQQASGRRRGRGRGRSESKHPVYKGVRKRQGGKWVSEIREPGKKSRIWLGTFSTPEKAARAYDLAAFNLKSPYAYVNFPEAVSSLPVPRSRSPKHIQEAASAAAAAFRGDASTSHARRTGGLVATSQAAETSNLSSTSSPIPDQHPQSATTQTTAPSFFDEDLVFNMPSVLAEMAEGLMITPPLLHHDTDGDNNITNNGEHDGAESSLWDF